jgi:hypothetical protein
MGDGHTLATGRDSFVYLALDQASTVKMDQRSKLAVSQVSRKTLSMTILSGNALVEAAPQNTGEILETRIGNVSMGVRGTLYVIGHDIKNRAMITMLDGSGEVDGIPLSAGQTMIVFDEGEAVYEIIELDLELMDLFALQTVLERQEILIENGVIDESDLEAIPALITIRELALETELATVAPVMEPEIINRERDLPQGQNQASSQGQNNDDQGENNRPTPTPEPTLSPTHPPGNVGVIRFYTVVFTDWDATILKTETVQSGASATPPAAPVRSGRTFVGWLGPYTNVTNNIIITAQFQLNP